MPNFTLICDGRVVWETQKFRIAVKFAVSVHTGTTLIKTFVRKEHTVCMVSRAKFSRVDGDVYIAGTQTMACVQLSSWFSFR